MFVFLLLQLLNISKYFLCHNINSFEVHIDRHLILQGESTSWTFSKWVQVFIGITTCTICQQQSEQCDESLMFLSKYLQSINVDWIHVESRANDIAKSDKGVQLILGQLIDG